MSSNTLSDPLGAVLHSVGWVRPVKPAAGPGLTFDKQSHKDDVCVSVTLTGKKEKKTPSLFTLSSHIWDCNALSWLHKYTPGVCGF